MREPKEGSILKERFCAVHQQVSFFPRSIDSQTNIAHTSLLSLLLLVPTLHLLHPRHASVCHLLDRSLSLSVIVPTTRWLVITGGVESSSSALHAVGRLQTRLKWNWKPVPIHTHRATALSEARSHVIGHLALLMHYHAHKGYFAYCLKMNQSRNNF